LLSKFRHPERSEGSAFQCFPHHIEASLKTQILRFAQDDGARLMTGFAQQRHLFNNGTGLTTAFL
jgi:hypothetical protein